MANKRIYNRVMQDTWDCVAGELFTDKELKRMQRRCCGRRPQTIKVKVEAANLYWWFGARFVLGDDYEVVTREYSTEELERILNNQQYQNS